MIVKPLHTSESIEKIEVNDYDRLLLEEFVEKYGYVQMFDSLNEVTYYGNDGNFNRTGGSRVRRVGGALQAVPSLLISTAICWPATLISALGALSHRMRKKFEDKNSWLNRLDPRFWNDYLGTYHEREKRSKKSSINDGGKTWVDRAKTALFGAGAAGAGLLAGKKLSDKEKADASTAFTKDDVVNAAFTPYWVTLSNGEVLRLRADSPENAMILANMIIAYTTKPCYEKMNYMLQNPQYRRYKFNFNDGEVCYWAGKTQNEAYEQALTTRIDLCDQMNQVMPDVVQLDNLEEPEIVGKVEVSKGELIPVPEQNKFISVSSTKPEYKEETSKKLPSPVYCYGILDNYRAAYANFVINIPATDTNDAVDIVRRFDDRNESLEDVYDRMEKKQELYQVKMKDGDIYYIPGETQNDAVELAAKIYVSKVNSIRKTLQGEDMEEYEGFLKEFGSMLNGIKSVSPVSPKDYTLKKGNQFVLKKYVGKGKEDIEKVGNYNF